MRLPGIRRRTLGSLGGLSLLTACLNPMPDDTPSARNARSPRPANEEVGPSGAPNLGVQPPDDSAEGPDLQTGGTSTGDPEAEAPYDPDALPAADAGAPDGGNSASAAKTAAERFGLDAAAGDD